MWRTNSNPDDYCSLSIKYLLSETYIKKTHTHAHTHEKELCILLKNFTEKSFLQP